MVELSLNKIKKYYGANLIIEDISFEAKSGERIGIVGRNGTGKTTIFKIISKIEGYDDGALSLRKGATVGYLDQIPLYPDSHTVTDVLNEAFKDLLGIKARLAELEIAMSNVKGGNTERLIQEYGRLQDEYIQKGGYDIDEKVSRVSTGLKLSDEFKTMKFNKLSGGEKTRVLLGKILMQAPNILLLDEPSNHLDIHSVEWLEEYLREYSGTALIISHDRYFLDNVVNKIIEIENMRTSEYRGNYSYYVEEKRRRFEEQLQIYQTQQKKIIQMEEAIKRFKDWGTRADNEKMFIKARNMQRRINKMDKIDSPKTSKKLDFEFNAGDRSGKEVLTIKELSKSFDDKNLLSSVDFSLKYGDKVALLGKNGTGKTTLINMIMGKESCDKGDIKLGSNAQIAYSDQNIGFEDEDLSVIDTIKFEHMLNEQQARNILASFLFYKDDVYKKIKNLSGGERSRLKICSLIQSDINFIILDEPTNHLDIDSREVLEEALREFDGTILFISHDRYFINKLAHKISEIEDKKIINYIGNYDYYKAEKHKRLSLEAVDTVEEVKPKKPKKPKINNDKKKDNSYKLQFIENDIQELEEKISKIDSQLEAFANEYDKLTELLAKKKTLNESLNILLDKWCELS